MSLKKGDLIDEHKRHPHSCGLVVKIMGGGAGFEKIVCCDHELTDEDRVSEMGRPTGRKRGVLPIAVVIDEKILYPDSCGLRVMIMDGGAGFKEIRCCGHSLTTSAVKKLRYNPMSDPGPRETGPSGTA